MTTINNPLEMVDQIRQNPLQFVLKRGFNIPHNIGSNPSDIIQYLMNTGQVTQDQYNNAVNMAKRLGTNLRR